jgi:hypothetical protein
MIMTIGTIVVMGQFFLVTEVMDLLAKGITTTAEIRQAQSDSMVSQSIYQKQIYWSSRVKTCHKSIGISFRYITQNIFRIQSTLVYNKSH